jgi:hypothetical protein
LDIRSVIFCNWRGPEPGPGNRDRANDE